MTPSARPIQLLPPLLRNQIAAGEVVERPASVLKELVENSLDAGATEITVTLEGGGQTLLAVRDNGCGIQAADLELALTRHATSKIVSFEELNRVASYGFRGEALPSIASVSHLRLESAPAGEGAFLEIRYGQESGRGPSALSGGTLIQVRDLFTNVPARLKFLKAPPAEQKRCQETLVRLALAKPETGFLLQAGTREILRLPRDLGLFDRLGLIWPPQVTETLIPFDALRHGIRAHGLASPPQTAQARGDRLFLYVNGRPVTDRLLLRAVREAYKGRLTTREYPQIVLFLELDPREVDVNVHPAKTEVRFREERAVFAAVLFAVSEAFARKNFWGPAEESPEDEGEDGSPAGSSAPGPTGLPLPFEPEEGLLRDEGGRVPRPQGFWGSLDRPVILPGPRVAEAQAPYGPQDGGPGPLLPDPPAGGYPVSVGSLVCLAQVEDSYLVLLQGRSLLVLDQHAAHERVLLHALERETGRSRLLVLPEILALHPAERALLEDRLPDLTRLGFVLEPLAPESPGSGERLQVRGLPALLERSRALEFLRDLLADKTEGFEGILHLMACHAAIRAGQPLSGGEAAALLARWQKTPDCLFCPHGRPTAVRFSPEDLERLFKRKMP
ncbi:MAG: DNA mismatch repair endonuclease MutL [Desulfovibrio sp.]|nr:DNA mismatch repair endonuclease MutL [Desulfovibrio sp.]